jgi:hypothetical protein
MPSQQVSPDLVQACPRDVMHINYPPQLMWRYINVEVY